MASQGEESVASFVESVQAGGRLTFSESEIPHRENSDRAVPDSLRRLQASGKICRVSRKSDLFVIIPPEFRTQGAPPIDWWLDDLMRHLGMPYYVGLLTAAQWHGSSHFGLMETQVVASENRKPIVVGRTSIRVFASAKVATTPVETRMNMWGSVTVSTPAATLVDLAEHRNFGPDRLAMATVDLLPKLTPTDVIAALNASGSVPSAQRLGFLLDRAKASNLANVVEDWIGDRPIRTIELDPNAPPGALLARRWRVGLNANLEATA